MSTNIPDQLIDRKYRCRSQNETEEVLKILFELGYLWRSGTTFVDKFLLNECKSIYTNFGNRGHFLTRSSENSTYNEELSHSPITIEELRQIASLPISECKAFIPTTISPEIW